MSKRKTQRKYLKLADRAPDVKRLLNDSLSLTAIGKELGCSRQHIARIIKVARLKKWVKRERNEAVDTKTYKPKRLKSEPQWDFSGDNLNV